MRSRINPGEGKGQERCISPSLPLSPSLSFSSPRFISRREKREQKRRDGFRRVGKENSRCAERIIKRQGSITETIRAFRGVKRLLTSDHRRRIVPVGRQHLSPRDAAEFAHSASDGLVEDRRVAYQLYSCADLFTGVGRIRWEERMTREVGRPILESEENSINFGERSEFEGRFRRVVVELR